MREVAIILIREMLRLLLPHFTSPVTRFDDAMT